MTDQEKQDRHPQPPRSLLFLCSIAVLISLCYIVITYTPGFITGQGAFWQCRTNDCNAHLTGLRFFIRDAWRFPLFDTEGLNYPTGTNIIFTDSLPLMAIPAKFLYQATGIEWNYFGWWAMMNNILLAVSIVLLLDSLNVRSIIAAACAVMFGLCATPFLFLSFYHIALSSHYLIVLALALYFYTLRQMHLDRLIWLFVALLIAVLFIHLYLFVMVYVLFFITIVNLGYHRLLSRRRCLFWLLFSVGVIFVLAFCMGYFRLDKTIVFYHGGYKIGSLNLLDFIIPVRSSVFYIALFDKIFDNSNSIRIHLGAGVLLLWLYILIRHPKPLFAGVRRHFWLALMLAAMFVFSLSNRIYCGKFFLLQYEWVPGLQKVFDTFRATDRFVWPLYFMMLIVPPVIMFKYDRAGKGLFVLFCAAAVLQNVDVWKLRMYARLETAYSQATENFPFYESIIPSYDMIIISEEAETRWGRYQKEVRNIYYLAGKYHRLTNYCLTARSQTEAFTLEQIIEKTMSLNQPVLYVMPYTTYQHSLLKDRAYIKNLDGLVLIPYSP
jgi:hypothetical protein